MNLYKNTLKPFFDFIVALSLIIVFMPIMITICLIISILSSDGIFFNQVRPGKNGRLFKIWKFKTMSNEKDSHGNLLPDEKRITPIGLIIRKLSLDELPQLFNVLRGQMSIIGPRPLLPEYLPLYSAMQARRHEVKPGITGWAQVNGRNTIDWETKFEYDVWYVDNVSLLTDLRILFLTVGKVVKRSDISSATSVTMEKFIGSK